MRSIHVHALPIVLFAITLRASAQTTKPEVDPAQPLYAVPMQEPGGRIVASVIDAKGRMLPGRYEAIGTFSEGMMPVRLNGLWGFINATGQIAIMPQFPEARAFSEGLASVMDSSRKWGFIDSTGRMVITPEYERGTDFSEGLAGAVGHGLAACGYIDHQGKVVIPMKFFRIRPFSDGVARVSDVEDTNPRYIDKAGRIVPEINGALWSGFHEGFASMNVAGGMGFIARDGTALTNAEGEAVEDFSEGLAAVKRGGQWGYVNRAGTMTITPAFFDSVDESELGRILSMQLDLANDPVLGPVEMGRAFHSSLARVRTKTGVGFINHSGNLVITPRAGRHISSFRDGAARFFEAIEQRDGVRKIKFGYLNTKGQEFFAGEIEFRL